MYIFIGYFHDAFSSKQGSKPGKGGIVKETRNVTQERGSRGHPDAIKGRSQEDSTIMVK